MNNRQKEVIQSALNDEARTLRELKQIYGQASKDCAKKIAELSARTDMENLQSIIYQKQYQQAMKDQIDMILNQLNVNSFTTISDYLGQCYETGWCGTFYDLQGQGIPMIIPIDQSQVVQALQTDSKLSQGLYKRLGEDTTYLKKSIRAEMSRGIASGKSWNEISEHIAKGMNSPFEKAKNNAMRITRTEGHRVQMTAQVNAQKKAIEKGADVVKQWDSTLDAKTRDSHAKVDGEFRKIDEKFSNGLMFPSDPNGSAAEVCNCRCCLLQRAKWSLDEDELQKLKDRAAYFGLDKSDNFREYKKEYLGITEDDILKVNRDIPEIKFNTSIEGVYKTKNCESVKKINVNNFDDEVYEITFSKRETTAWDDLPDATKNKYKYSRVENKAVNLDKGTYKVEPFTGGYEREIRDEIAKNMNAKYLGTNWNMKNGMMYEIDFYEKDGEIFYSIGQGTLNKKLSKESLDVVKNTLIEREGQIIDGLKEKGIKHGVLMEREGDDWKDGMIEFHNIIGANSFPEIISDAEYKATNTPVLYRGIASQSRLRKDISSNISTKEMAHEFFESSTPFPSRGVYGDGVAYCSPAYKEIGVNYATNGGSTKHGGVIIEFKLKEDANVIQYEDAVSIFKELSSESKSDLLFNPNQKKAYDKEVGKTMNVLGYDAIIKHNGDNTGCDFYVILNRGSLVAKSNYITTQF